MAVQRSTLTAAQIDGLLKTRRANKMENFNLEAKLKVLDHKKSQAYIQIDIEKDSLRKNIEKIQHVKQDVGTSAERRKLFKNVFKGTARSQLPESGGNELAAEGNERWHSRNERLWSNSGKTESAVHSDREVQERHLCRDVRRKSGIESRARHHFRVIDPPSRPGSRRNFLQVSDKALQKEQEQELQLNRFEHDPRLDQESVQKNCTRVRSSSYESVESSKLEALSPTVLSTFEITNISDAEVKANKRERPQELESSQNFSLPLSGNGARNRSDALSSAVSWSETESDPKVYDSGKGNSRGNFASDEQSISSCCEFSKADHTPSCKLSPQSGALEKMCENAIENNVSKEDQTLLLRPKIEYRLSEPPMSGTHVHKLISDVRTAPCSQVSHLHENNLQMSEIGQKYHLALPGTDSQGPSRTNRTAGRLSMHRRSFSKSCPHLNLELGIEKIHSSKTSRTPSPQPSKSRRPAAEISSRGGLHYAWTPSAGATTKSQKDEGVYAYDARPNKSLSKGYQKMQVTVGRKQLSVYMPRFVDNSDEPVLARIRNKVTNEQFQPRLLAKLEKPK